MTQEMMLQQIQKNRANYLEIIQDRIEAFLYRSERYDLNFSLAIGYCSNDVDLSGFGQYIRSTDEFIILEKNICCIVLDCAPAGSGVKAATNMLSNFQHNYFGKTLYSSVVCSEDHNNSTQLINQLFDVLSYSISHNMDNMVVDPQQMLSY